MPPTELSPVALALGRVPTGLYIVTTRSESGPLAFLGSFLTQVGIEPPTLCVAIGKDRLHLAAIRDAGHFGVSILDAASASFMGRFLKKPAPGKSPFDGVKVSTAPGGSPVLEDALAWLECRASGEHPVGDHVVVFGEVIAGRLLRDGEPSIHLRRNGLGY